ncbi:MAG: SDR family NAD(P)-dependent oxidoreductase [Dokdonella sp.]
MTALVVGASSGLGRALANELAHRRHDLLLVSSDARDLESLMADLSLRHGVMVRALALDLAGVADPGARIAAVLGGMAPLSALLLPVGYSREDDDFSLASPDIGQLLATNLHAPLAITHALLPRLLETRGVIVLFGSVAAIRGRGRNVVYAAAKRGLVSLYESLRQRYRPDELRVQFYQLGFLATNLTWGMRLPMSAVDPSVVACMVADQLARGSVFRHIPRKWAMIAIIIRALPWAIYRRMRS